MSEPYRIDPTDDLGSLEGPEVYSRDVREVLAEADRRSLVDGGGGS